MSWAASSLIGHVLERPSVPLSHCSALQGKGDRHPTAPGGGGGCADGDLGALEEMSVDVALVLCALCSGGPGGGTGGVQPRCAPLR